jgi:hypothetical protein
VRDLPGCASAEGSEAVKLFRNIAVFFITSLAKVVVIFIAVWFVLCAVWSVVFRQDGDA